uniref:Uncharacterized protein n=1 Tax=Panagrolaimus davidi TaxID=227884 RepID=A0A914PDS6_9BILA
MDENGKEYFIHDQKKHICKPIKITSIQSPSKFQRLERKDIVFKAKENTKPIEEEKILKLPNFEFRQGKRGTPEGKLVIFDTNDKSLNCQRKNRRVTAKVHLNNETNEKFIKK